MNFPPSAQTGENVAFNGAASQLSSGSSVVYRWNFGDGAAEYTGAAATHSFDHPGHYSVSLTVSDSNCSTSLTYTSQFATCNGSSLAKITSPIQVIDRADQNPGDTSALPTTSPQPPPVSSSFSASVNKRQRLNSKGVAVKLKCRSRCHIRILGRLENGTHFKTVSIILERISRIVHLKVPQATYAILKRHKRKSRAIVTIRAAKSGSKLDSTCTRGAVHVIDRSAFRDQIRQWIELGWSSWTISQLSNDRFDKAISASSVCQYRKRYFTPAPPFSAEEIRDELDRKEALIDSTAELTALAHIQKNRVLSVLADDSASRQANRAEIKLYADILAQYRAVIFDAGIFKKADVKIGQAQSHSHLFDGESNTLNDFFQEVRASDDWEMKDAVKEFGRSLSRLKQLSQKREHESRNPSS